LPSFTTLLWLSIITISYGVHGVTQWSTHPCKRFVKAINLEVRPLKHAGTLLCSQNCTIAHGYICMVWWIQCTYTHDSDLGIVLGICKSRLKFDVNVVIWL
jgi:hypothetical protein